jgi:hypothetical protein
MSLITSRSLAGLVLSHMSSGSSHTSRLIDAIQSSFCSEPARDPGNVEAQRRFHAAAPASAAGSSPTVLSRYGLPAGGQSSESANMSDEMWRSGVRF